MKRRIRAIGLMAAVALGLCACHRPEIRTITVQIPQLRTPLAASMVRASLSAFDTNAVLRIEPDLAQHRLAVTYDSTKLAARNIQWAIAQAGFDADDIPANPKRKAALPPECRGARGPVRRGTQ